MLDIQSVIAPENSAGAFRAEATQWTLARDRYLSGILPFNGLVGATWLLVARTYRAVTRVELAYTGSDHVLTDVVFHTRNGERFPLPGFDDRLPLEGPPWFTDPAMEHVAQEMSEQSFEETARVLSDWFDGITADYEDVLFTMLAIAFVARDSEGTLTALPFP